MFIQRKQYWLWILATSYRTIFCYNLSTLKTEEMQMLANEDYIINTPGCYIPNYEKNMNYHNSSIPSRNINAFCEKRAVFVRLLNNNRIQFLIHTKTLVNYIKIVKKNIQEKPNFSCCFRFGRSTTGNHLKLKKCKSFRSGTKVLLWNEIILVYCFIYENKSKIKIYEDAYIIIKRKRRSHIKYRNKMPWNVLLIGMDTMSRARVYGTMPMTIKFLKKNDWLDYRGYHKIADNTFPNLMAVLTGVNESTAWLRCRSGLSQCSDSFIWNKYRHAGYRTAYGEDYITLPDTFSKFDGFKKAPTDHYMQPFFYIGENVSNHVLCMKKKPSAIHLLQYAYYFAKSYKNDDFFGMFWINSLSHNERNDPSLIDRQIVHFFEMLNRTGIFNNTFIVFFSDHGIRFGKKRFSMPSYYDDRLPMLFMWTPHSFRNIYKEKYENLQLNQYRLTTPYDLHNTLTDILKLSVRRRHKMKYIAKSDACPKCTSLFKSKSISTTCADAGITETWCGCHNMTRTNNKHLTHNSMFIALASLQNLLNNIKTKHCTRCRPVGRTTILRSHSYSANNKTYHVIAFMVTRRMGYEAIIAYYGKVYEVLSLRTISAYEHAVYCVLKINESLKAFCVCEKIKNCR